MKSSLQTRVMGQIVKIIIQLKVYLPTQSKSLAFIAVMNTNLTYVIK